MSNIDKQALRDIAIAADSTPLWNAVGVFGESVDPANPEWKPVHDFCKTFTAERVLALLDELEALKLANAAQDDHINQQQDRIDLLEKGNNEAAKQINSWRRLAKQNIAEREKDVLELNIARKQIAELQNDEVRQRLANAEHQLHMAELAKHNLRASRKAQFRKRKVAERRIAELEARTVTLPENITSANAPEVFEISAEAERLGLRGTYASYAVGWNARGMADKEALRAASICIDGES